MLEFPTAQTVSITVPPAEAATVGIEYSELANAVDTAVWALGMLRTGRNHRAGAQDPIRPGAEEWEIVIRTLHHRLLPRVGGIVDAAIRAHAGCKGGTYKALADAMEEPLHRAQYRRQQVTGDAPGHWEEWAVKGGNTRTVREELPPAPSFGIYVMDDGDAPRDARLVDEKFTLDEATQNVGYWAIETGAARVQVRRVGRVLVDVTREDIDTEEPDDDYDDQDQLLALYATPGEIPIGDGAAWSLDEAERTAREWLAQNPDSHRIEIRNTDNETVSTITRDND